MISQSHVLLPLPGAGLDSDGATGGWGLCRGLWGLRGRKRSSALGAVERVVRIWSTALRTVLRHSIGGWVRITISVANRAIGPLAEGSTHVGPCIHDIPVTLLGSPHKMGPQSSGGFSGLPVQPGSAGETLERARPCGGPRAFTYAGVTLHRWMLSVGVSMTLGRLERIGARLESNVWGHWNRLDGDWSPMCGGLSGFSVGVQVNLWGF
jgi:hypothetical protein